MSLRPQASRHAHVGLALPLACITEQMVRLYHLEHDPRAATAVVPRSRQRSAPLRERDGAPLPASRQRALTERKAASAGFADSARRKRSALDQTSADEPPVETAAPREERASPPAPCAAPLAALESRAPAAPATAPAVAMAAAPPTAEEAAAAHAAAAAATAARATAITTLRETFDYDEAQIENLHSWRGGGGESRLIWAAREGCRGELRALLALGADPALRDLRGWTALHHAAVKGHSAVAQLLIDAGGALDALTKVGPIFYASTLFSLDGRCPRSRARSTTTRRCTTPRRGATTTPCPCCSKGAPIRTRVTMCVCAGVGGAMSLGSSHDVASRAGRRDAASGGHAREAQCRREPPYQVQRGVRCP